MIGLNKNELINNLYLIKCTRTQTIKIFKEVYHQDGFELNNLQDIHKLFSGLPYPIKLRLKGERRGLNDASQGFKK